MGETAADTGLMTSDPSLRASLKVDVEVRVRAGNGGIEDMDEDDRDEGGANDGAATSSDELVEAVATESMVLERRCKFCCGEMGCTE